MGGGGGSSPKGFSLLTWFYSDLSGGCNLQNFRKCTLFAGSTVLARYCPMESQTGSRTHLEFMRVISTAYDRNDLAYRERSSAHNSACVSPIETIKLPL